MSRPLKIIFKLIGTIAVIVILVFFGTLWYINYHKNKVLQLVNNELNDKLDGTVIIGDLKPNFFQRFPDISLGLKNVLIRDKRFAEHHRTLLDAKVMLLLIFIPTVTVTATNLYLERGRRKQRPRVAQIIMIRN
jgi:uncharacterized membrane protein affecting hemolysin expression